MEDFIKIHCKKAFKGTIDIRSTYVKQARNEGRNIAVTCDVYPGEVSKYSVSDLSYPIRKQGPYKSKVNQGEEYYLYVFEWRGNNTLENNQQQYKLF